jgi:hypothetical protein
MWIVSFRKSPVMADSKAVPYILTDLGKTVFTLGRVKANTLMQFIHDVGLHHTLISDDAKEKMAGRARDT